MWIARRRPGLNAKCRSGQAQERGEHGIAANTPPRRPTLKISAKTEYACIAMMELAAGHESGKPVRIREIAATHGIPSRFLVQILLQLKGAGFVRSTRGAAGGYRLAKSPEDISLADVMNVIDRQDERPAINSTIESTAGKVLRSAWMDVARARRKMLAALTFGELLQRAQRDSEGMYYI